MYLLYDHQLVGYLSGPFSPDDSFCLGKFKKCVLCSKLFLFMSCSDIKISFTFPLFFHPYDLVSTLKYTINFDNLLSLVSSINCDQWIPLIFTVSGCFFSFDSIKSAVVYSIRNLQPQCFVLVNKPRTCKAPILYPNIQKRFQQTESPVSLIKKWKN